MLHISIGRKNYIDLNAAIGKTAHTASLFQSGGYLPRHLINERLRIFADEDRNVLRIRAYVRFDISVTKIASSALKRILKRYRNLIRYKKIYTLTEILIRIAALEIRRV